MGNQNQANIFCLNCGPPKSNFSIQQAPSSTTHLQGTMSWLRSLFGRAKEPIVPFDFERNPYKAKKLWPPHFNQLSEKEQFRFERKFRRRNKLAWARPGWTKFTKLTQWGLIIGMREDMRGVGLC